MATEVTYDVSFVLCYGREKSFSDAEIYLSS